MFEIIHEFNFLNLLSILAFFTTVGLFFCGIPICRQIWKRKDTTEISGAPFIMGVLGGTCWLTYGILKKDDTVIYVTSAQITLYSVYVVFFFFMTQKKFWISMQVVALVALCASLGASVHFFGHKVYHPLGIICMVLNIADFAAPLAGLRVVIRRRATSTLPLPLCIANFLVSTEWFLYGLLVWDFYLITPNGIGSLLAFSQLILFIVLPRKPNQRAPFLQLIDCFRSCGINTNAKDIENAAVVPAEKNPNDQFRISKHRWSSRVITNMAGEIENVIQKVHLADQFAYSNKLNKSGEEAETGSTTESVTLTPENAATPTDCGKEIVFPLTIRDERQLMQLSQKLSSMSNISSAHSPIPPPLFSDTKINDQHQQNSYKGLGAMNGWTTNFSQSAVHPNSYQKNNPFTMSFNGMGGGVGVPALSTTVNTINEEEGDQLVNGNRPHLRAKQLKRCRSAPELCEE